jgi:hypothetical protein
VSTHIIGKAFNYLLINVESLLKFSSAVHHNPEHPPAENMQRIFGDKHTRRNFGTAVLALSNQIGKRLDGNLDGWAATPERLDIGARPFQVYPRDGRQLLAARCG